MMAQELSPLNAFLSGQVTVTGDRAQLEHLRPLMESKGGWNEATLPAALKAAEKRRLQPISRHNWVPDHEAKLCQMCATGFGWKRWRHHCRYCGGVFCNDCLKTLYGSYACINCFTEATTVIADGDIDTDSDTILSDDDAAYDAHSKMMTHSTPPAARRNIHSGAGGDTEDVVGNGSSGRRNERGGGSLATSNRKRTCKSKKAKDKLRAATATLKKMRKKLEDQYEAVHEEALMLRIGVRRADAPPPASFYGLIHMLICGIFGSASGAAAMGVPALGFLWSCLVYCTTLYASPSLTLSTMPLPVAPTLLFLVCVAARAVAVGQAQWAVLMRRRLHVYSAFLRTVARYKAAQWREKHEGMPAERAASMWNSLHEEAALDIYLNLLQLRGFWVKLGQYLSTRSDVLPEPWISRLKGLQDCIPPRAFSEVRQTLDEELRLVSLSELQGGRKTTATTGCAVPVGATVDDVFAELDETPIAAASIAQVHRGVLVAALGGREVAVKVQHRNVGTLMRLDLLCLRQIVSWLQLLEPDFDFRPLIEEWATEAVHELDFCHEATATERVRRNLERSAVPEPGRPPRSSDDGGDQDSLRLGGMHGRAESFGADAPRPKPARVRVPRVIWGLTTRKLLVLEFIRGVKITDAAVPRAQRARLVEGVVRAYSHMLYVDGLFNCDPHPGNILVGWEPNAGNKGDGSNRTSTNHHTNSSNMEAVLLDFGLTKDLPEGMRLAFARLVLGAAQSDTDVVIEAFNDMGLKLDRHDPESQLRMLRHIFRDTAPPGEAREQEKKHRDSILKEREDLGRDQWVKIEAWPGELVFFLRTLAMLRGLCTTLGVRLPILGLMAGFAARAIAAAENDGKGEGEGEEEEAKDLEIETESKKNVPRRRKARARKGSLSA